VSAIDSFALPFLADGDPADRVGFLGATDIAALECARRGIPYFSGTGAWRVWMHQKHPELIAPPSAETQARFDLGHHLEPYVLGRFDREVEDVTVVPGGYVYAPEPYPWMRVQLDGLMLQADTGELIGQIDAKATEIPWEWREWEKGDLGWQANDALPAGYLVQAQAQMGVLRWACAAHGLPLPQMATYVGLDLTGAPMLPDGPGRVRLDLDAAPLMVREVEHDEAKWRDMAWYCIEWWNRYIVGDEEPPDDDAEACQRWRHHEQTRGMGEREATADEQALIAEWLALKAETKR